ncbi:hypothetical protein SAMN04487995_1556 [Dyadobacter koreensis]|uniref:Uncharacterized protein n=1 Tax=Dyadobacter koreensis TaxID=408657 RepID=A0A1H6RYW6_9BACT|nr:hypothetical protein SAMN04487995_1556 [Dyadobacter koreensis]
MKSFSSDYNERYTYQSAFFALINVILLNMARKASLYNEY